MLLWIKAVLLTLWHSIVYIVASLAIVVAIFAILWALIGLGNLAIIAFALIVAAFLIWLFVIDVRDNHERLQTKAWLEESARGGEEL